MFTLGRVRARRWWGRSSWRGASARRTMTGEPLAARARAADRAQPAPLRRLPRARRDRGPVPGRGRVLGVRRAARRAAAPGPDRSRWTATRSPTGGPPPSSAATAPAPARRSRSGAVLDVRKGGKRFTLRPSRNYYSTTGPLARARSRASSRARPPARSTCAGACGATSGWRSGPTSARSTRPIREADRKFAELARRRAGARDRRARRALPPRPAAGGVPRDRRRRSSLWIWIGGGDRGARRARGALALAGGAAAPGALALRGPPGPRALARLDAPWNTRSPCIVLAADRGSLVAGRCRCAGRERGRSAARRRASRSSRPPRRPSTARSATPSSTTRWASSPRRTGARVDRELRGEAIEILRELDRLEGRTPPGGRQCDR